MSTVVIKRSARRSAPEIPTGELAVEPPPDRLPVANLGKESGAKVRNGAKEAKETPKKVKQAAAQVNAKDRAVKTGESAAKKHWYDLFRRNSVTVE